MPFERRGSAGASPSLCLERSLRLRKSCGGGIYWRDEEAVLKSADTSTKSSIADTDLPEKVCGYPVRRVLTADTTFLAEGEGGRLMVLKRVDDDCMLGKGLHPSIAERLARVREVAHAGVGNLIAVEKGGRGDAETRGHGEEAWMVWEYVEGETLLEWAGKQGRTARELLVMGRELMLSVDQLHMQGLVHGSIVGGNVIVGAEGGVKLTHVSPLLYTDFIVDVESVVALLKEVAAACGERGEDLRRVVEDRTGGGEGELRRMAARVAGVLGGGTVKEDAETRGHGDAGMSGRWVVAQIVGVIIVAGVIAYGIWRAFGK